MNYLAHFYLSGPDDDTLFGNFIGDWVKGKQWEKYDKGVQNGIFLHRFIDDFMDKHPFSGEARKRIRNDFGLTAPVVLDIYFDHFLTRNWSHYESRDLAEFSQSVFDRLRPYHDRMEGYYPSMVRSMEEHDWINSYRSVEGVALVLRQMARRVRFSTDWDKAGDVLEEHYTALNEDFLAFFPEMIKAVEKSFNIRLRNSE